MPPSSLTHIHRALLCAGLLSLAACGGGGGSSSSSSTTVSGVAATGAALGGATVTITDASGTATSCGATNASTGAYTCTLGAGATAPFVLSAVHTESGTALFSVLAEKKDSTAHITPLTHAIAAALSPTGDPSALAAEVRSNSAQITPSTINTQVGQLQTALTNVLSTANVTQFDPIGGSLTAGSSSGMDKVLDAVRVSVAPRSDNGGGNQAGTVTIALRGDPDSQTTLTNGSSTAPTPISNTAVQAANTSLNPSELIAELLGKMNTCYALVRDSRVDSTASSATAANVVHADCRAMFYNADPATFKSGGATIGASASSAFRSLFRSGATGTTFDQGNLEYVVKNPGQANDGIWVVSYRSTASDGSVERDVFALKLDANNKLRQYGNQYDYDVRVRAFVQNREFIKDSTKNYLSTGYTLHVANRTDSNGNTVFEKVVVTSPGNRSFTLRPTAGLSYLALVGHSNTVLGTNAIRIGYGPLDSTAAAWSAPADVSGDDESRLFFASTKWTDAQIAGLPDQGTWTFDIYLAGNTSSTPDATQRSRTLRRAPTLAEVRRMGFAALTDTQRAEIVADTSAADNPWYIMDGTGQAQISDASGNNAWSVPTGAVPPTKVQLFGRAPKVSNAWGASFNDTASIAPAARKAIVPCSRQSTSDVHCHSDVAVNSSGNYANGSRISDLQLNAHAVGVDLSKHVAFYLP